MEEIVKNFGAQVLTIIGVVLGIGAGWRAAYSYIQDNDAKLLSTALWLVVAGGFVFANEKIMQLIKRFWESL